LTALWAVVAVVAAMTRGVNGFATRTTTTTRQDLCRDPPKTMAKSRHVVLFASDSQEKDDHRGDCFIHNNKTTTTTLTRRNVLWQTTKTSMAIITGVSPAAHAEVYVTHPSIPPVVPGIESIPSFVAGTITIPEDFDFELAQANTARGVDPTGKTMTPLPALYVTARPNRPDHVPQAILQGTNGKPPPVLSARFEQPTFPFAFHLTPRDYTVEGKPSSLDDKTMPQQQQESLWWANDDLVVSARLDMDGIAATRSPEDLVGRTLYQRNKAGGEAIELKLVGRGAFGKFATGQSVKQTNKQTNKLTS
jgi:hypothetical protein